ncbi:transcriptional activator FlhD [Modicisalibacter xianhensis]|uniref:Transcriptional activator FlhD n=1 Tax=Modicisalibacter xianhensis TaxID=442341 RepID=A0A4R8FLI5_9GAMM|nr:flagellar transcriptional regulator FlhD [Halomonas xianhensis]TDX24798.1 transcriptional activator FlhD [Halomonas xianhensis]
MHHGSLINEIQEVNLAYLLLAQKMIEDDRDTAMFRLKITAGMADLVTSLSTKQLTQMVRSSQLLCRLALGENDQWLRWSR